MASLAAPAHASPSSAIGRFELQSVVGRGAQATVWRAYDPKLEREVCVKLLHEAAGDDIGYGWRREAVSVSRLAHPNIVPVFEAGLHDGRPYLVFEYVRGETLAQALARRGKVPQREAVHTMLGVLAALEAAHAAGIVHRDLKPSNILIDVEGRPRVADFGIAARLHEGDGLIVGTPGYLSPEAARGQPPTPAMDVFSAGVVLIEMLSGAPLIPERDERALIRVSDEDIVLPPALTAGCDDVLCNVLLRAIARFPADRLASAAAFGGALSEWLNPAAPAASAEAGGGDASAAHGMVDFVLRRMRHRSDFPALSEAIARIQRITGDDDRNLHQLAAEVSADVALTHKLLRLVNTAHYSPAGGGSIATVARAVALVGFSGIRNMALSLVLLDRMQNQAHAGQLKGEYLRSLMAGTLANELAQSPREAEEAFVGAMFQNLGRLLTRYYLFEEAEQIAQLVEAPAGGPKLSEAQAAVSVLGLSYEELGLGVAKRWGLPESLRRCIARPSGAPPQRPAGSDRLRWLTLAANDIADVLLSSAPDEVDGQIQQIGRRYAQALGVSASSIAAALERSRERLVETAAALDIGVPSGNPARRFFERRSTTGIGAELDLSLDATVVTGAAPSATTLPIERTVSAPGGAETVPAEPPGPTGGPTAAPSEPSVDRTSLHLAAGIQAVSDALVGEAFDLSAILRRILETLHQAFAFRCVVFCLRDPKTETLRGRIGTGTNGPEIAAAFQVPLRVAREAAPDLFTRLCRAGVDSVIADTSTPTIRQALPPWYRAQVDARGFVLLPLIAKGTPFGLIYADWTLPQPLTFSSHALALIGTLRNQALMAFRQAAGPF